MRRPMLAVLETIYSPGELVAVAYRDGAWHHRGSDLRRHLDSVTLELEAHP